MAMQMELEKGAAVSGDVLSFDNKLYCIENRVFPNYARGWLMTHGFYHTHRVQAGSHGIFDLFEKEGRPRVAIPERQNAWK